MNNTQMAYMLALGSSFSFSLASLMFTEVTRQTSALWMNTFKALVAWLAFGIFVWAFGLWIPIKWEVVLALLLSGGLGLAIGDVFLLTAYARMGSARTLILYGFQPFFIGVGAHFLFAQDVSWQQGVAVLFFLGCLFVFSLERFRSYGHWEVLGLGAALLGVLFDNGGVLLSRWAFEQTPEMHSLQTNFIRCSGALLVFSAVRPWRRLGLRQHWLSLSMAGRRLALVSSILGTFFSLLLYLWAIKIGHLASLAALGGLGPIFSSAIECVYYRKRPSIYLLVALVLFLMGFSLLVLV